MKEGKVFFARHGQVYVLKFVGDVYYGESWSFELSKALTGFLDRIFREADFDSMVIDLTETTYIDSTNLGLIAEVAKRMRERGMGRPLVVSTNPKVTKTLEGMGFGAVMDIVEERGKSMPAGEELPAAPESELDLRQLLLQTHRTLAEMNEQNAATFKNVIDALERDQPPAG